MHARGLQLGTDDPATLMGSGGAPFGTRPIATAIRRVIADKSTSSAEQGALASVACNAL